MLPAPITIINVSSVTPQLARVDWNVDYRQSDERPNSIIISLKNQNTSRITLYEVMDHDLRSYDKLEVVPGMEYRVTLESINEDGNHITPAFSYITQPTRMYTFTLYTYISICIRVLSLPLLIICSICVMKKQSCIYTSVKIIKNEVGMTPCQKL